MVVNKEMLIILERINNFKTSIIPKSIIILMKISMNIFPG